MFCSELLVCYSCQFWLLVGVGNSLFALPFGGTVQFAPKFLKTPIHPNENSCSSKGFFFQNPHNSNNPPPQRNTFSASTMNITNFWELRLNPTINGQFTCKPKFFSLYISFSHLQLEKMLAVIGQRNQTGTADGTHATRATPATGK